MLDPVQEYLAGLGILGVVDLVIRVVLIPVILRTKRDSTAATAWVLIVLLVPLLGAILFWVFGYNRVYRPLQRKRRHRAHFLSAESPVLPAHPDAPTWENFAALAVKVNALPLTTGNRVTLYHGTTAAFAALLDAVAAATHHVHVQFFLLRRDETGRQLLELLARKAKAGVEVRLLVDGIGTGLMPRRARVLRQAGCKVGVFLPINPLLLRVRVNLRNHRKIVVVDGRVGFTGGMNVGDEYLGKDPGFGYWRDTFLRVEGPAAAGLQRVFSEDWDFATGETLTADGYFPPTETVGPHTVQVAPSGPDQDTNGIRAVYFAAIMAAKRRVWIASPYCVPDAGLLDALRLARLRGVEVRLLTLLRPDHYVSFYAGRYFWADMLALGVLVYQYARGMMHSKVLLIDDDLALVGSANFDNRSLHLNFEAGCLLYSPDLIAELARALERDCRESILLDATAYAARSRWSRLAENACRLFAPIL